MILLIGRLYEHFNIKYLLMASFVVFEAGSALCGAAPSAKGLILGRVVAGTGGAGLYLAYEDSKSAQTTGFKLMARRALLYISIFSTEQKLPLYNAFLGIGWGVGAILGPIIGGALSDSNATWRWVSNIQARATSVEYTLYGS